MEKKIGEQSESKSVKVKKLGSEVIRVALDWSVFAGYVW